MIRYFKTQPGILGIEFVEQPHNQNHHAKIVPKDNSFVIHMMEGNSNLRIPEILKFVNTYNPTKLVIDYTATETYIENKVIEELEEKLKNIELKILTANITNNQYKSHIFFQVHAFQLLDSFGSKIETINYIQDTNLNSKKRLKKYLFLNHHLRTERFKIFESLYNNNKLNDGLVSFCWNMEHDEFNPQWYDVNKNDIEYIKNSNAYSILPLELDGMNANKSRYFEVKNEIQNPRYFSPPNTNISHYFNVYFEIITEGFSSRTPFHPYADRTNILHYSEKIFKPILFGVPFCFWGPENTLEQFSKQFGMTFNCPLYYCNDGYDLNDFCDKINELSNLSYLELHKLYYDYYDEIRNNQQILINYLKNIHI
jgi:hypothetical protein